MCGFVGQVGRPVETEVLRRARDRLTHRGPDDAGLFQGANVALAARRLSIIDIEGGHQPVANETGNIHAVLNGEIYNAKELREDLVGKGHVFKSQVDTECLVHAYEQWGSDFIKKLRGMFAFGLYDQDRRSLLLGRDRFGIKPLYYLSRGGVLTFGSEVRPLFDLENNVVAELNAQALFHLFQVGFVSWPETIFRHVQELPPAHLLEMTNGRAAVKRYADLDFPETANSERRSELGIEGPRFLSALREAVHTWKTSDVEVASLLSGGLDSSALARILTDLQGPIHTFSLGFSAHRLDESGAAQLVADEISSKKHRAETFDADDMSLLQEVVRHLETPQCSATSVSLYKLYRNVHRAGFKVVLTGEGADELLGGYEWFQSDLRLGAAVHLPPSLRRPLAKIPGLHRKRSIRVLAETSASPIDRYSRWLSFWPEEQLRRLIGSDAAPVSRGWEARFSGKVRKMAPLNQFLYLDSQTRLPGLINHTVDRMSMAHSVEARAPFLDHLLWEQTVPLAGSLKATTKENKIVLRAAMKGLLPESIRRGTKKGLAAPYPEWLARDRLTDWAEDLLSPSRLARWGLFDPIQVASLRASARRRLPGASRVLLGVLTTQLWSETFL